MSRSTVTTYPYTTGTLGTATSTNTYSYGNEEWGDLLTAYNGQTLTYDNIGNPLTWRNGMTMTWQDGRRLSSLQTNGKNIQYTYDADGLRVTKTVDGTKYTYQYVGGQLRYETRGNISFSYEYDAYGNLSCIHYIQVNGTSVTYYVACNSHGDVTAIYNAAGTLQAKYSYDSWGNTLSITNANGNAITSATHIGNLNMIRYRGYYFDSESGLYYLQSRYYDPQVKRFLNADGYVSTGQGLLGTNMFAYCGNNPIMRVDPDGESWILIGLIAAGMLLFSGCSADSEPVSEPESPKPNVEPYSSYGGGTGNVYIVTEDKVAEVGSKKSDTDVIIVDHRTNADPNMQIKQSYKIGNKKHQKEIAQI